MAARLHAAEKGSEQVSPFFGTLSYAVPIEVPAFHGLEPGIALTYNSEGRNGTLGVGWALTGFSTIERANAGRGTPRFDGSDVFLLDGQELLACTPSTVSPSCASGGTHATKIESYSKIRFDTASSDWTVWAGDGTRTVLTPIVTLTPGIWRWGVARRIDTLGNQVDYTWTCLDGECYPSAISYNGYGLTFYRELRPDALSSGAVTSIAQTRYRFRSILVGLGSTPIRAYKLGYTQSPLTGRSLLASVQQYGRDVAIDAEGAIGGGTSLPPVRFTYQDDAMGKGFHGMAADPTPPGTLRAVTWNNLNKVVATGAALNSLYKNVDSWGWDAGASSIQAIASGDGYVEWTVRSGDGYQIAGLSNGDTDAGYADVDFAIGEWHEGGLTVWEAGAYMGSFPMADGDKLRVEVQGGVVRYKRNGATFYTSTRTPVYPLRVDTSIANYAGSIQDVFISGALQDLAHWCVGSQVTADFNADGRTDQACYNGQGLRVALATPTGFQAPTSWHPGGFNPPWITGDFDGDGKLDIADFSSWQGWFRVALSTGTAISNPVFWGEASGWAPDGFAYACRNTGQTPTNIGTGDFNGDGRTDVWCKKHGYSEVFVGISTGSAFSFSIWAQITSDFYERVGSLDFDGDGKDDWYAVIGGNLFINRSTGSSFLDGYFGGASIAFCDESYVIGDFNGDGRADVVCRANGNIALSTGRQFVTSGNIGAWCGASTDVFAADVDGDGASELVCNNGPILVRKWAGSGFGPAETWKQAWCPVGALGAGDFNGDTKTDLFCRTLGAPVAYAGTGGLKADLLSDVTTSLGGTLGASYTLSTATSANGPPPKYVVASLTTGDGRGGTSTRTFSYGGAYMHPLERRFIGFRQVVETLPCVAGSCPTVTTLLRQDLPSAGSPERVEWRGGAGVLREAAAYEYVVNGTTLPFTSLLSATWSYTYDGTGATCSTWPCTSAKRTRTEHQYDAFGNRTQTTIHGDFDAEGDEVATTWVYRPNTTAYIVDRVAHERIHTLAGAELQSRMFWYDDSTAWDQPPVRGLPTAALQWLDTESRWVGATRSYDTVGNATASTDPTGRTTTTSYESTYRIFPVSVRNPAGETSLTTWDPICGVPLQKTDANGLTLSLQYDALCRPTRTDGPMGSFEARAYLDVGNPAAQRVEVTTPSAMPGTAPHYAVHHQDGLGRVYRQVRRGPAPGQDIVEETSYDARGRVAAKTAAYYQGESPQTTTLAYDFKGRLVKATHADGTAVLKSYGLWSETTIDEHGHPTTVRYDAYGRAVRKEPVPANYTYDLLGHLIGMTDALGNAWSWTFDSLGRNLLQHDPDSGQWSFEYDDAGRPTAHTDAKGQRTEFTYDSGGRLAGRTNPDGTVTYTYSETRAGHFNVGRITTVRDPASVLKTDYDALGRAVGLERTLDGTSYIFQRRYDATGRPLGLTYPDGDVVGTPESPFRYDLAGRLLSVPGILSEVLYDAAGRPVRQANANGTVTTRTYSPERGFLTGVHTSGATTIQDLAYSPDSTGLVTQVTSPFAGESWVYAYDNVHRLVSAESLSSPSDSQTFQYDEIDRIVFNSRLGPYSYPSPGQPRPHAPLQVAGDPRSYDPNGNLIASGGRSLSWTADNRLRQADTTQFTYDATGERLRKTSADSISVYPLGDDYEVTDGVITKYVKVGALGVVGKRVGGTTYWLHTDRLRSIQAVTDASGAEIFRRTYRPYGDTLSQGGAHIESRGYTDQRRDDATGLVYLHARYYDPEAALFVSPDPLHPTSPGVGANRYAYSGGNPTNVTDPTGLTSCSVITISIGGEDYTFVDCAEEVTVVDTGAGAGGIDPIDFFRRYILPFLPLPIPAPDPVTPDPPPTPQPSPSSPPPTTPPQTPNQPPGQPPGQTPTTPPKGEGKKPPSIPVIPVIPKPDEPFWTAWDHWKWFRKVTTPIRLVKAIDCSAEHTTCVEQSDRRCEAAYPDGTRDQVGMFAFTQSTCKLQGVNDCLGRYASCQSPFW